MVRGMHERRGVRWRKSSYSNGSGSECVEVAALWRKSSYSNGPNSACVEVAAMESAVGVRDSKDPTGPTLTFGATDWTTFLAALK